ncbi:hypothetical protein NDU88_006394 [Pleurodeles waltl]|uniref:Uncharacterized protein n=1 Tax=Pleurodeles waltl TaxID=8319 RepID=A0AAV7WE48_PLEWA|nr:hypothetical protein NDU88_006394 [Pleurodeles waltl]
MPFDFQRENRHSACREGEISPHRPPERRRACHKPRIPRTDPGVSENPATRRGSTTERRKSTHSRPCVETKWRIDCVRPEKLFPRFSSSAALCGCFSHEPAVLETAGPSGAVLERKGPAERCLRGRAQRSGA